MPGVGVKQKKGNIPLVTAYEDEANIFTEIQKVRKQTGSLLTLNRVGVDTNNSTAGIDVSLDNLAHAEKVYTQYLGVIEDSTTSSEKGQAIIKVLHTGALRNALQIFNDGSIKWGTPTGPLAIFSPAGLTTLRTFTFPDADATLVGSGGTNVFTVAQQFNAPLKMQEVASPSAAGGTIHQLYINSATDHLTRMSPAGAVVDIEALIAGSVLPTNITLSNSGLTVNRTYTFPNQTTLLAGQNFINIFSVAQLFDVGVKVKPIAVPTTDAAYGQFYSDSADSNKPKYKYPSGTVLDLSAAAGGGEANTMQNMGVGGVGVYKQKTGVNFEMKNLNATNAYITVTNDAANNEIDIGVGSLVAKMDNANIFTAIQKFDVGVRVKPTVAPTLDAAYGIFYTDSGDSNKPKFLRPDGTVDDLSNAVSGSGDVGPYVYDAYPATYTFTTAGGITPGGKWHNFYLGSRAFLGFPADVGQGGVRVPAAPTGGFPRVFYEYPYTGSNTSSVDTDTSSTMFVSNTSYFEDFDATISVRTKVQKRTVPKNHETAWLFFHLNEADGTNFHHYYLVPKMNGTIELGRKDNITHEEEQTFLHTSATYTWVLNTWNKIRVKCVTVSTGIHITVWIDDVQKIDLIDDGTVGSHWNTGGQIALLPPSVRMYSGLFGIYNEDAEVEFGPLTITELGTAGTGSPVVTYSTAGTGGTSVPIILTKDGTDLPFKGITPLNAYITVTDDVGTSNIDIGVGALVAKTDVTNIFSVVQKFDVGGIKLKPVSTPSTDAAYGILYSDSGDSNKPKYKYPSGTVLDLSTGGGSAPVNLPPYVYDTFPVAYVISTDNTVTTDGKWRIRYRGQTPGTSDGAGRVGVRVPASPTGGFARVFYEYPYTAANTSSDPDVTSSSNTTTEHSYWGDFDVTLSVRLKGQRRSVPNFYEAPWVFFHYNEADGGRFHHYYLVLKTNGRLELGRKDNTTQIEEQTFLYTSAADNDYTYTVNTWNLLRILCETDPVDGIHIHVWIDGVSKIDLVDDGTVGSHYDTGGLIATLPPSSNMYSGIFGMYVEDAEVEFSPMTITELSSQPGTQSATTYSDAGSGSGSIPIILTKLAQDLPFKGIRPNDGYISVTDTTASNDVSIGVTSLVGKIDAANVFTAIQKITINDPQPLTLYRPINTVGLTTGTFYNLRNSANAERTYGISYVEIEDNVDASLRGDFFVQLAINNVLAARFRVYTSGTGGIIFGNSQRIQISEAGLTAGRVYTLPDVTTLLAGVANANVFTAAQRMTLATAQILTLYRSTNVAGDAASIYYNLNTSTSVEATYGIAYTGIEVNTNTAHRGDYYIQLAVAGALAVRFRVYTSGVGGIIFGNNGYIQLAETNQTSAHAFTFPNVSCALIGTGADDVDLTDGKDIGVGTTNGTAIATGPTQKLSFHGATPVVQAAANADTSGATLGQLETEVNELKALLRAKGLMAT
jgi:hypothetical protein